jgi:gamma-glutamyltranspeptidase / glutathione hydrolase
VGITAAVAAPDRFAADTATEVLEAGGNAVDAAVATAFALAVTFPEAGNIGGSGFATVHVDGQAHFLDFRGCAPGSATPDMYLDGAGNVIAEASTIGAGATAVPGTVAGLWELHQRFGKLAWAGILAPAIRYAREGFPLHPMLIRERDNRAATLKGRTNFLTYFGAAKTGDTLGQPELEATLRRIASTGPADFYEGQTADLIADEMSRSNGHVTRADLKAYRAKWRKPLIGDWAGYQVVTAPPPSSGGVALLSLLEMKAHLSARFAGLQLNSAQYIHLLAEIEKRVFADRAAYFGDPDFVPAPVGRLLDPAYLARRAVEIDHEKLSPTVKVVPGLPEHHCTTHFSIQDFKGNAVSLTYTVNDLYGCGQVVTGAGFLLNNDMDDFSVKPGVPNKVGVLGGTANAIAPGKRPLSTMSPTILTRDGHVAVVIGTPGGSRIATSIFQVLTNWHDFGMPLAQAVAAPRIHHQLHPSDMLFEEPYAGIAPEVRAELMAFGYQFERQVWNGDIHVIAQEGSGLSAVSDPRGRGESRVLTARSNGGAEGLKG